MKISSSQLRLPLTLGRSMATPLLTKEQRAKLKGKAFKYARDLLLDDLIVDGAIVGRAPFSHIDVETIAQKAYSDGFIAARRLMLKGEL